MIPIVLALVSTLITYLSQSHASEILLNVKDTNADFFTIMAILVGFNITSISLIAVFNKITLRKAFSNINNEDKKEKALRQLISSFVYGVFIQIGVIVLGFFYNINVDNLLEVDYVDVLSYKKSIAYTFYTLWNIIIFHSFIVTIRNITLIYKFILVVYKNA